MSPQVCSTPADSLVPEVLDLQLIAQTQAYLRCRERHETPSVAESQGWDRFYNTYDPLLRRFVAACGAVGPDAEDCRQEAWMEIVRQLAAFHSDGTQRGLCSW